MHWGAKELSALTGLVGGAGTKLLQGFFMKKGASQATKSGAKFVPGLSAGLIAKDLLSNPWHVARSRAEQTAAVLADLLARVQTPHFILAGHSLGARVMLRTAELLATKGGEPRLESIHLLGAAVGTGGDWKLLNDSIVDRVHNYYSKNDDVLRLVYPAAQGGQQAVGYAGFNTSFGSIEDIDVTDDVASHSGYLDTPSSVADSPAEVKVTDSLYDDGWAEWIRGGDPEDD